MPGRVTGRWIVLVACAAAIAAPSIVAAQVGVGGAIGRRGIGGVIGARAPMAARSAEETAINTVDLVLRHFHDLALSDTQVTQLTAVKARQDSLVARVRVRLDSIVSSGTDADGGARLDGDEGRRQVAARQAMKAYRDVLKRGRSEAFDVLDKGQRKRVEKLEAAVRRESRSDERFAGPERR